MNTRLAGFVAIAACLGILPFRGLAQQTLGVRPLWTAEEDAAVRTRLSGFLAGDSREVASPAAADARGAGLARPRVLLGLAPGPPPLDRPLDRGTAWIATIYDYAAEKGYRLRITGDAGVENAGVLDRQAAPSREEIASAIRILRNHPQYGAHIVEGRLVPYPAMPPVDYTPGVPRTLHIGLRPTGAGPAHEIVGVRLGTSSVVSYAAGASRAPAGALAAERVCGLPSEDCDVSDQGSSELRIRWPAEADPVWDFVVVRPSATLNGDTPNGAGVELRNVRYRGQLVLARAHVPVLNVKYDGDTCGPYRDWLHEEGCFGTAGAQQIQPGFHLSAAPPQTICATGSDAGTGRGVGIQNTPAFVAVTSEMEAAWYRYLNGWRFHANGNIEAIFQYAGTVNSCMCSRRTHHAYWRLDWALGGLANPEAPGGLAVRNVVELRATPASPWQAIASEGLHLRTAQNGFRVRESAGATQYVLEPGAGDGTALNDPYAQADLWILRWKPTETSDAQGGGTEIDLAPYLGTESVQDDHVVTWYAAHLRQDGNTPGSGDVCTTVGPTLVRSTVR